ncbi:sulfite exporter TauE/SafE family protein [Bacillus salitolerans]|uniref:Probable membrane transporter protein n=1 Tax=Bacillus salitolerans TaxID=1437434 RepID=A0ABW4LRN5_9BACI
MEWILIFLVGILAGTLGSLLGLGGGIIVVPALLFLGTIEFMDISPQVAVGTSLLSIIATGMASTIAYVKKGLVDLKSGFIFFIGSGPGGIVGAYANGYLHTSSFSLYFGLFILFISFVIFIRDKLPPIKPSGIMFTYIDMDGRQHEYGYQLVVALSISFVVGFLSGLFGIGGGALMVPVMLLFFRFPVHVAVATSMFMILLSSITSSITHYYLGNIEWLLVILLVPGAWIGANLGSYINTKLMPQTIMWILRIFLLVLGLRLIYEGILGY